MVDQLFTSPTAQETEHGRLAEQLRQSGNARRPGI